MSMQLTKYIFIILSLFTSVTTLADPFIEERNFVVEAKLSILPKIPVMNIDTILMIEDDKYEYKFSIRTNNIVDFINKVNGDGSIIGIIDEHYKPLHYKYKYTRKDKEKFVEIKYNDSVITELILIPEPNKNKLTKIEDDMLINTIDPSSFFLNILNYHNINNCEKTFRIFDGKRRYDVLFSKNDKGISNGLIYCEAKQVKLGGYKIGEEDDDVFASSDYIRVIFHNNDKKDFYGYEANNGAITLFINEIK
tara:strand:+ start:1843 stop:2595 length:753 start_codon:yes stop_codon:yes gene_type:complete